MICLWYGAINASIYSYFVGINDMLMVYGAIYKRQYTDKALTLWKSMFIRASRASELENFGIFTY